MARTLSGNAVRGRIAAAVLGGTAAPLAVGRFTLWPTQRDAVERVRRAIASFGGALLADPPGRGKTVIALAVALRYRRVVVAAPAALRDHWLAAAARAARPIAFFSFETLSRGTAAPVPDILIVDEAHHARSPTTRRYRALATIGVRAPMLLVSATPVVNRGADRDALLALFLGARAAALAPHDLATLIVRQPTRADDRPPTRWLGPLQVPTAPAGLAAALLGLPPPFPTADGTAALPLVRLTLAMAWCSSLAALDASLRRRVQRGEAIADGLRAGRWPDRRALRDWVVDGESTQLAMPLLLVDPARRAPASALATVEAHTVAVRALRDLIRPAIADDIATRAQALLALADAHPGERMVVFFAQAESVRALFRALRTQAGVVAITGQRVLAAHGRWSRGEVLRSLGPNAPPWRAGDPRGIRILLATDLLAEGVELQGMRIVVHGDPAWTPARLEQRVGRVARPGGPPEVLVTRFALPPDAARALALARRLREKRRARRIALDASRAEERIRDALTHWIAPPGARCGPAVATVEGQADGFLLLLRSAGAVRLVGGRRRGGRWRLTERPRTLAALVRDAAGPDTETDACAVRAIRRAALRWWKQRWARGAVDGAEGSDQAVRRALRRRCDAALERAGLATRSSLAGRWGAVIDALRSAAGAGATLELQRVLREPRLSDGALLDALEALVAAWGTRVSPSTTSAAPAVRGAALLIVRAPRLQAPPRLSGKATRSRSIISLA